MKKFNNFDSFIREIDEIQKGWHSAVWAVFIKKDDKEINYGQTGRVFETNNSIYFFPDETIDTSVFEVVRGDILITNEG